MAKCRTIDFFGYIEGFLDHEAQREAEEHLSVCVDCGTELKELRGVVECGAKMAPLMKRPGCLSADEMRAYLEGETGAPAKKKIESHIQDCRLCGPEFETVKSYFTPGPPVPGAAGEKRRLPGYLRSIYLEEKRAKAPQDKKREFFLQPSAIFADRDKAPEPGSGVASAKRPKDLARLMDEEKARLKADLARRGLDAGHKAEIEAAMARHEAEMERLRREFETEQERLAKESARHLEKIRSGEKAETCECGAAIDRNWKFCPACGRKIGSGK